MRMQNEMLAQSLTTCQVAPDGSTVRLGFEDTKGEPSAWTLPTPCIQQLVMTLPRLLSKAIKARHRDDTLRAVFPLGTCHIESEAGTANLILTLMTADGFEVAFALTPAALDEVMATLKEARMAVETRRKPLCS